MKKSGTNYEKKKEAKGKRANYMLSSTKQSFAKLLFIHENPILVNKKRHLI